MCARCTRHLARRALLLDGYNVEASLSCASAPSVVMPLSGAVTTVLRSPHVQVDVGFASVDYGAAFCVRYGVRSIRSIAIAVFNRGNWYAVLTRQQISGAVGVPRLRDDVAGAVMLLHVATGLPSPASTLLPTPLPVRLELGGKLDAGFTFAR